MSTNTAITPGRYADLTYGDVNIRSLGNRNTVGNTNGVRVNFCRACLQVQVASIGTDVQVALMGSLDGVNYFNIGATQTIATNGFFGFIYPDVPVPFLAARLVAINGGTPTVTFTLATS